MTFTESHAIKTAWIFKCLRWLFAGIGFLCRVVLIGWATLALYYSNLPWAWLRLVMAAAFVAFGIWALWVTRRPRRFLAFAGVFLSVLVWWLCIRPSHDRHWRPEVAVMPRAIIDGDRVRIMGCRNFEYRSRDDFTVRYDERVLTRASSQHERGMECGEKRRAIACPRRFLPLETFFGFANHASL